jgi:hypothetical protein
MLVFARIREAAADAGLSVNEWIVEAILKKLPDGPADARDELATPSGNRPARK